MRNNLNQELQKFGKFVIQQSKSNLSKKGKKASSSLYNSLDYDFNVSKNSFELSFKMEDYWEYVDRGVKGAGGNRKYKDGKKLKNPEAWELKKVKDSPFKYTNKMPPTKSLDSWVVKKGLAGRNKSGQFISRAYIKFAVAKSIFHTGIETTNFFTRPFELAFKKLPDDIIEAFALDVEDLLKFSLK
jgi:hypothetical protein